MHHVLPPLHSRPYAGEPLQQAKQYIDFDIPHTSLQGVKSGFRLHPRHILPCTSCHVSGYHIRRLLRIHQPLHPIPTTSSGMFIIASSHHHHFHSFQSNAENRHSCPLWYKKVGCPLSVLGQFLVNPSRKFKVVPHSSPLSQEYFDIHAISVLRFSPFPLSALVYHLPSALPCLQHGVLLIKNELFPLQLSARGRGWFVRVILVVRKLTARTKPQLAIGPQKCEVLGPTGLFQKDLRAAEAIVGRMISQ